MKLGIFVWVVLVLASCTAVEVNAPLSGGVTYGDFTLKEHGRL